MYEQVAKGHFVNLPLGLTSHWKNEHVSLFPLIKNLFTSI